MESIASNSPPSSPEPRSPSRSKLSQPIADRVARALDHPLRLLHRSNPTFFVLGATGNVYIVTLSTAPSCTCPDRTAPCKHILFTFIRVLGVSLDDIVIRRRTLRPCQLHLLLASPTSPGSLAGAHVRQQFHHLFSQVTRKGPPSKPNVEVDGGATCPVCLDEMRRGEKVLACEKCRNPVHQQCMWMWRRSKRKRTASCVICRARWINRADQETYLNLAAYVGEGGDNADGCKRTCGAG